MDAGVIYRIAAPRYGRPGNSSLVQPYIRHAWPSFVHTFLRSFSRSFVHLCVYLHACMHVYIHWFIHPSFICAMIPFKFVLSLTFHASRIPDYLTLSPLSPQHQSTPPPPPLNSEWACLNSNKNPETCSFSPIYDAHLTDAHDHDALLLTPLLD